MATKRVIELASSIDVKLFVVSFDSSKAKDPDEFISKDPAGWKLAVKNAQYAVDYVISKAKKDNDLSSALGKKQFAKDVLSTIATLTDEVEKAHYVHMVSQLLGVNEDVIEKRVSTNAQTQPIVNVVEAQNGASEVKLSRQEKIEEALLEVILTRLETRAVISEIQLEHISDRHKELFLALHNATQISAGELAKLLPEQANYVNIISLRGEHVYSDVSEHDARLEAFTQVNRLNKIFVEKTKRSLSAAIAAAEAENDTKKRAELLKKYQDLLSDTT